MSLEERTAASMNGTTQDAVVSSISLQTTPLNPSATSPQFLAAATQKNSTGSYPAYFEPDQLYNLADDPNEQSNLASDTRYASVLTKMQSALKTQLETLPGSFGELKP